MDIISKLDKYGFRGIGECSDTDILQAEKELGISFPPEYRAFLKKYKSGVINGCEIMGVNTPKYIDTVFNTLFSRENDDNFPHDCFVLENIGVEGALTISDSSGQIFTYCAGNKQPLCNSLSEFFDYLMNNNK